MGLLDEMIKELKNQKEITQRDILILICNIIANYRVFNKTKSIRNNKIIKALNIKIENKDVYKTLNLEKNIFKALLRDDSVEYLLDRYVFIENSEYIDDITEGIKVLDVILQTDYGKNLYSSSCYIFDDETVAIIKSFKEEFKTVISNGNIITVDNPPVTTVAISVSKSNNSTTKTKTKKSMVKKYSYHDIYMGFSNRQHNKTTILLEFKDITLKNTAFRFYNTNEEFLNDEDFKKMVQKNLIDVMNVIPNIDISYEVDSITYYDFNASLRYKLKLELNTIDILKHMLERGDSFE